VDENAFFRLRLFFFPEGFTGLTFFLIFEVGFGVALKQEHLNKVC